jgi:hypothetical protein
MTQRPSPADCLYCEPDHERLGPGWIEQDNNGPIVRCPVCSPEDSAVEAEESA